MVLLPGCQCCATCSYIMNASRVVVTVISYDAIEVATRTLTPVPSPFFQYPAGHQWTEAQLFPGATYAGTYELTKIADTAAKKTWRYQFPAGEFLSGTEYLGVEVTMPGSIAYVDIFASLRVWRFADLSQAASVTRSHFLGANQNFEISPANYTCYSSTVTQPILRTSSSLDGSFSDFSNYLIWPYLPGCQCSLVAGVPSISPNNCQQVNTNLLPSWFLEFPGTEKCPYDEFTVSRTEPVKQFNYKVEFF